MQKIFNWVMSSLFHPLLLPTIGLFLLFRSDIYFAYIPGNVKRIVLLITFLNTCVFPSLFIIGGLYSRKVLTNWKRLPHYSLVYLVTGFCYYLNYLFMNKVPIVGFYKAVFLSGALLLVGLAFVALKWNISAQLAGLGAMVGLILAIMFRLGSNNVGLLAVVLLISGLAGTARLMTGKNNPAQVYAGYLGGLIVFFFIFYLS